MHGGTEGQGIFVSEVNPVIAGGPRSRFVTSSQCDQVQAEENPWKSQWELRKDLLSSCVFDLVAQHSCLAPGSKHGSW